METPRYEYMVVTADLGPAALEAKLNDVAAEGWRVILSVAGYGERTLTTPALILERERGPEGEPGEPGLSPYR
jgi:hypothetical protein